MKKKPSQTLKTYSNKYENFLFYGAFTAMFGGAIFAAVKIQQAENARIQAARASGAKVVETPWGTVIY